MLTRTRLKVAGALLGAAVVCGGHSAVIAHADATGDATMIADATAADALLVATAPTTWTDPNITCGPDVSGGLLYGATDFGVGQLYAQEEARGDVSCFSFTNTSYTLTAWLSIMEFDPHARDPKNPYDIQVCATPAQMFGAVDGLSTAQFTLLTCEHLFDPATAHVRQHIAVVNWTTTIPFYGTKTAPSSSWTIDY